MNVTTGRRKQVADGRVLEHALAVLADGGRERFTLARVAVAAGVAPPTLIQRFHSKAELIVASFAYSNGYLRPWLDERSGVGISELLADLSVGFGDAPRFGDHLTFLREGLSDPDLSELAVGRMVMVRGAISERLPNRAGDRAATAELIESHWHGAVLQWAIRPQGRLSTHVERSIARLLSVVSS